MNISQMFLLFLLARDGAAFSIRGPSRQRQTFLRSSRQAELKFDLTNLMDKYILSGSPQVKSNADRLIAEVQMSEDIEFKESALQIARNAGFPISKLDVNSRRNSSAIRKELENRGNIEDAVDDDDDYENDKIVEYDLTESLSMFNSRALNVGGLDDVLLVIRTRVFIPLAAPAALVDELGIAPVRGLLLFGDPGCGKTMIARKLANILSPFRPATVVSGPEIMEKFVGESEANLRTIFDEPPPLYIKHQMNKRIPKTGDNAPLHIIVFDEFDAISRKRGGSNNGSDQGDAGVARDSVVNQLLASMDGFNKPVVPTLIIGMTNKKDLIDPALLRSGRFEIKIEIKRPSTVSQRIQIFRIHTAQMEKNGRIEADDYEELLKELATGSDEFSGADIAATCRNAGASALSRAVNEAKSREDIMLNCLVTNKDFRAAINAVRN